jgi:hypothetical protein
MHQEKRPLGKPRRRCEDRINTDFGETGYDGVDYIQLIHNIV